MGCVPKSTPSTHTARGQRKTRSRTSGCNKDTEGEITSLSFLLSAIKKTPEAWGVFPNPLPAPTQHVGRGGLEAAQAAVIRIQLFAGNPVSSLLWLQGFCTGSHKRSVQVPAAIQT